MRLGELLLQERVISEEEFVILLARQKENPQAPVGELLIKLGFTDMKTLVGILAKQDTLTPAEGEIPTIEVPLEPKIATKLDEILLRENLINDEQLGKAVEYQNQYQGTPLGQALIDLGFATQGTISAALRKTRRGE